jgi:mannose-6-phosphate isomerase-like protein (cupin superfamily)
MPSDRAHFRTKQLPTAYDVLAPDGAEVRVLLALKGGSMAHFKLGSGQTSRAITHRSVEEIWYFLAGRGEMWRRQGEQEEVVSVGPGVCLTIPVGTHFQFRATDGEALAALGITMPPWPGEGEAVFVQGKWEPALP